jgi:integrase
MAAIYKRLLSPNKKGEQLLIFVIKHGNNIRLDYSSEVKLNQKYWNKDKLVKKSHSEYLKLNNLLRSIEALIQVIVTQLVLSDIDISKTAIKKRLDSQFQRARMVKENDSDKQLSFYKFAYSFIKNSYTNKKAGTVKTYLQTLNRLKDFDNKLDFQDVNMEFYSAFVGYLRNECGILDSTIGKHIKNLKAILNEATEQGHNSNLTYRYKKFKTFREEADSIYLTKHELSLITNLDLSKRSGLERVRDLFLIGCNTGLRFSDLKNLNKGNIHNRDDGQYILIRTQKTEKQVMIPINATVKAIIVIYHGEIPMAISNQKMNLFLKEICKMAGLDSIVQVTKKRAGELEKHNLYKYQLVSTHTARRSFATNAYLSGVPALAIMKITGHKSESSFMKYIKGSQEENAFTLSKHPFFS